MHIKTVEQKSHKKIYGKEEERQTLELDFGDTPEKLRGDNLDMYKGIWSGVISTNRFDQNSDLSTTYLGMMDTTRPSKIKAEEKFSISEQRYTKGIFIRWNRM